MLVFPPEGELLLILVCLLLLPALSAGAGLPQKLGKYDDEYRTEIHDTAKNGTNLIEVRTPIGLNVFGARMSILHSVKPVNSTRNVRDGVISSDTAKQAVPRGVNFMKANGRNLTRTNKMRNVYFGSHFFGANGSRVEAVEANITGTVFPDIFGTNKTNEMYGNGVKDTEKELEFNSRAKSRKGNNLHGKSRRSLVDQVNSPAMFLTAEVADDGNVLLEAMPATAAVEAADAETLPGTTTASVYEGGNGGDEADYYDEGDDNGEDNNRDRKSGDGNDLGEDDKSGDRDNITDGGNSGDRDNIIVGNNRNDCVTIEGDNLGNPDIINEGHNSGDLDTFEGDNSGACDTIEGNNSGDGDHSGDDGDNDGSGDVLDEGCGDYSGPDKDDFYDINDYDYDEDEVEDAGDDSTRGFLGIGDPGGDFDSLEKIFPPHFLKLLLEKYYRTQQMMMSINIYETKEIEEYQA